MKNLMLILVDTSYV